MKQAGHVRGPTDQRHQCETEMRAGPADVPAERRARFSAAAAAAGGDKTGLTALENGLGLAEH
jgi:hypothetical protein